MTTYTMAGPADPRALLSAAALGSLAGLVLGAAYLTGASARHTAVPVAWTELRTRELPTEASPVGGSAPAAKGFLPRLRTAALAVASRPSALHTAAAPFQARDVQTSASDQRCLTQAVYYEARGESAAGQAAVAQVVLNRVRHPAFPKSVCGVVFQRADAGCQFSFACDGRMKAPRDGEAWRRAQTVAQRALDGFVMRQVGEATHFHVFNIGPAWSAGLARIGQIGAHVFYGFSGHAGAARMFQAKAQPSLTPHAAAEAPALAMASLGGDAATRNHAVFIPAPAAPISPISPIAPAATTPVSTAPPTPAASAAAAPAQAPVTTTTAPVSVSAVTATVAPSTKPTAS